MGDFNIFMNVEQFHHCHCYHTKQYNGVIRKYQQLFLLSQNVTDDEIQNICFFFAQKSTIDIRSKKKELFTQKWKVK
jgi:hypothetical protein